jgi:hypothetical protein
LQLPDVVSSRVLTLAQELVADIDVPYDRAVAIESYMRTFSYTLEVPGPPPEREVADFFIFDLQQGYCDYYATSMVVLARAVGLPARLVIGYVGGMYDPVEARYAVRESDAHAWVELYFPDFGWIEFEPTAGRPAIYRAAGASMPFDPASLNTSPPPLMPPSESEPSAILIAWREIWPILAFVLVLISLVLGATMIDNIVLLVGYDGQEMATQVYHRLRKHAAKLRVPLNEGDTPNEFADAFVQKLDDIMWDRYIDIVLNPALNEVRALTDSYASAWYAPQPLDTPARRAVVWTWWKLRWRLWFARPWRKPLPRPESSPLAPYARWTTQRSS